MLDKCGEVGTDEGGVLMECYGGRRSVEGGARGTGVGVGGLFEVSNDWCPIRSRFLNFVDDKKCGFGFSHCGEIFL